MSGNILKSTATPQSWTAYGRRYKRDGVFRTEREAKAKVKKHHKNGDLAFKKKWILNMGHGPTVWAVYWKWR